jgi:hypothetical protein
MATAPFPTARTTLLSHRPSQPWFPTDCHPRFRPRAPPPPRLILHESHRQGQVALHFPLLVNYQRVLLLCSKRRAPPLGAAVASSCASVSPSTRGHLEPSRPPLEADRTPCDAVRFLGRVELTVGSRLWPRSEAISSSPISKDSPSSSPTDPQAVSGR